MMSNTIPLPRSRKRYQDIVEDILDQITKGVAKERHVFDGTQIKYALEFKPVRRIVKVEGVRNGENYPFENGKDFLLNNDMLEWIGTNRPDPKSDFRVSYIFSDPSLITDVNPGSVVRTIVEAISRELDFIYAQIEQVYRSGFIDTASGNALDLVAAIVGVQRKQPTRAVGNVTFWRGSEPQETLVNAEPILYDSRILYPLKGSNVKAIIGIKGIVQNNPYSFKQGVDYALEVGNTSNDIAFVKWLDQGVKPDGGTSFSVDYSVYQRIVVPAGTKVSTFSKQPENARLFETLHDGILERSIKGRWEATIEARALESGEHGNVVAGSVAIMPRPPPGIENVLNMGNFRGGAESEDDESLRARAKKALAVAGKATYESLLIALEGLEGIRYVNIKESNDKVPGIIKVVVDGGDEGEIRKALDSTKAAGIKYELSRPKIVTLDFDIAVVMTSKSNSDAAKLQSAIQAKVSDFVSTMNIQEDLIFNKLISALLSIQGVQDIRQMSIQAYREGGGMSTSTKENITIEEDEKAAVRTIVVKVEDK